MARVEVIHSEKKSPPGPQGPPATDMGDVQSRCTRHISYAHDLFRASTPSVHAHWGDRLKHLEHWPGGRHHGVDTTRLRVPATLFKYVAFTHPPLDMAYLTSHRPAVARRPADCVCPPSPNGLQGRTNLDTQSRIRSGSTAHQSAREDRQHYDSLGRPNILRYEAAPKRRSVSRLRLSRRAKRNKRKRCSGRLSRRIPARQHRSVGPELHISDQAPSSSLSGDRLQRSSICSINCKQPDSTETIALPVSKLCYIECMTKATVEHFKGHTRLRICSRKREKGSCKLTYGSKNIRIGSP